MVAGFFVAVLSEIRGVPVTYDAFLQKKSQYFKFDATKRWFFVSL